MEQFKINALLNRWKIEKILKSILFIQILFNVGGLYYPKWLTMLLPILTAFEISLLLLFYLMIPKIEKDILDDIEIEVLEQYISRIESQHFRGKERNYYLVKLSSYYYIFGYFDYSIALLKQVDLEKLPSGPYSALDYYFQAYISHLKMKNWDKLENIKQHFLAYKSNRLSEYKKKQFYMTYLDIFEKLFIQQSEVSELSLAENTPYEYVRSHYFLAVNALNKQDNQLAREEFQKLSTYPEKLYMVREAKKWLEYNDC